MDAGAMRLFDDDDASGGNDDDLASAVAALRATREFFAALAELLRAPRVDAAAAEVIK